jgi:ABC-type bacteriocin/lantibiotic exporter with double-glycine peptidase domain
VRPTRALEHRFYDVWEGAVRIGGRDVREVTQGSLGREIAMVVQEPFLSHGSFDDLPEAAPRGPEAADRPAPAG